MKITIEPTDDLAQLANVSQGTVWKGVTETGTPIVAIVVTLGCRPEDQAAFDRDFSTLTPEQPGESESDDASDAPPLPQPA